jgi:Fe2+ or Zn2+ uptake regulation protein
LLDREKIEEEKKFIIKKHSFELFGYCEICREKPVEKPF